MTGKSLPADRPSVYAAGDEPKFHDETPSAPVAEPPPLPSTPKSIASIWKKRFDAGYSTVGPGFDRSPALDLTPTVAQKLTFDSAPPPPLVIEPPILPPLPDSNDMAESMPRTVPRFWKNVPIGVQLLTLPSLFCVQMTSTMRLPLESSGEVHAVELQPVGAVPSADGQGNE